MSRRTLLIVVTVLAAQLVAVLGYLAVESNREATRHSLSAEPPRKTSGRVEVFEVAQRDGTTRNVIDGERPVLLHFWATWCAPCVDELPLLLDLPDDLEYEVVAVALDDDWTSVDAFIDGRPSPRVVLGDRALAERQFEISSLPQTVLVSAGGTLLLRVNGARDWRDQAFRAAW